ncbi:MAG: hypothetical protein ACD_71C00192G0002 [uncultured bacterium (gcode 4)]|uniref:Uncharacterized protein n=1 Tax=uncultured bacterium (gcode 4) TaxID=1234023 RepID=K1YMS1_9BACT|nr:MAG: hypothetical protein ACD_71C00192G0002 [uncultured bacterium (gcode 4)]
MSNQRDWKVVNFTAGGSYKRCQCCRQEDVRNIFIVYNQLLNITREVGKECAKNLTGQIDLIMELNSKMVSLTGKRERFCDLQSAKSWTVKVAGNNNWKSATKSKNKWAIEIFGHKLLVSETVIKSVVIIVDGEIEMDQTGKKPLYFNSMNEAKLYFFNKCANEILYEVLRRHYRQEIKPIFSIGGLRCENKI